MSREVKRSEGIKTVSKTDRQGNLKSEKTVYKGADGYKEKTKLKVSPKKDATSKPQATLTTTIKSKGGSKEIIERKGDYDSDYEYIRGNNKTILDRKPRKERKDLERTSTIMMKIKNPNTKINGDTTYPEGKVHNLSNSKKISENKFNRKLKKAKEGEVTQNQVDQYSFFGEKTRGFSVKNTNVKKKNNIYTKRETPNSDSDTVSYFKVKTKPTREQKKAIKFQKENPPYYGED